MLCNNRRSIIVEIHTQAFVWMWGEVFIVNLEYKAFTVRLKELSRIDYICLYFKS